MCLFNVNKHFLMYIKEEKDLFKGKDLLFCLEGKRVSKAGSDNPISLFLFLTAHVFKADSTGKTFSEYLLFKNFYSVCKSYLPFIVTAVLAHILKLERYHYCKILAIFPMFCTIHPEACLTSDSLDLPSSHPILLPPSRKGNHEFVLYICGSLLCYTH